MTFSKQEMQDIFLTVLSHMQRTDGLCADSLKGVVEKFRNMPVADHYNILPVVLGRGGWDGNGSFVDE